MQMNGAAEINPQFTPFWRLISPCWEEEGSMFLSSHFTSNQTQGSASFLYWGWDLKPLYYLLALKFAYLKEGQTANTKLSAGNLGGWRASTLSLCRSQLSRSLAFGRPSISWAEPSVAGLQDSYANSKMRWHRNCPLVCKCYGANFKAGVGWGGNGWWAPRVEWSQPAIVNYAIAPTCQGLLVVQLGETDADLLF